MCELEGRFQAALNVGLDNGKFEQLESPRPVKPRIKNSWIYFGLGLDSYV